MDTSIYHFQKYIKSSHNLHVLPDEDVSIAVTCKSIHNIRKLIPIKVEKIIIFDEDVHITISKNHIWFKGYFWKEVVNLIGNNLSHTQD